MTKDDKNDLNPELNADVEAVLDKMSSPAFKWTLLALPLVVLLALVGYNMQAMSTGDYWRVKITGYDPRDLLRGHYITFRYDWNLEEAASVSAENKANVGLCLTPVQAGETYNPKARMVAGSTARESCDSYILGTAKYGRFKIGQSKDGYGLTRYYVPESHAAVLDRALRARQPQRSWRNNLERPPEVETYDFSIGLRVNDRGKAVIEGLYIDDMPLVEWIKEYDAKKAQEEENRR